MPKYSVHYATESMHIPDEIINTGWVENIEKYLDNNPVDSQNKPLSDEARQYLEDRVLNMKYINKLADEIHHYPNKEDKDEYDIKMLPKKAIKKDDLIYLDLPHQPKGQMFKRNCWTMPAVMMLQARGIMDIDQENVLMYRPELTSMGSKMVLPEEKRWMNTDTFSNIKYTSGLINKLVPNSGFSQFVYTASNDEKKNHAYLTNMKGKIQSALLEHGSPVALNIGNHYITVVGMKGDELIYKDSLFEKDPDANRTMNIYSLFDNAKANLQTSNPTLEISYTFDITPPENDIELPKELKRFEETMMPDGKGGYLILPENRDDVGKKVQYSTERESQYTNQGKIGRTEIIQEEGIDIDVQETVFIPLNINKKVKVVNVDPTKVANSHWSDQLQRNPELRKTLKNPLDNSLYSDELEKEEEKAKEEKKQKEAVISQAMVQFNGAQQKETVKESKDAIVGKDLTERLNDPPLETGIKNVDIKHFRELEKNTQFSKEYEDMFEKEYQYVDSLPDGPLKKMTKMSIDARNAIKVLTNEPTPENKALMKEYAKIIVAQKLLAFEHEMNNGKMGATEKNIGKTGSAKIFLSEGLVNRLTDKVFNFNEKDFNKQIDDYILNDKGMDYVKDFVRNSVIGSNLSDEKKKDAIIKSENVFDKEHELDILIGLKAKAEKIDLSKLNNKDAIKKYKQSLDKLIEEKSKPFSENPEAGTFKQSLKMTGLYSEMSEALNEINAEELDENTKEILDYTGKFTSNMAKRHDEYVKNQNVVNLFENTIKVKEIQYSEFDPNSFNTIEVDAAMFSKLGFGASNINTIEVDAAMLSKLGFGASNIVKKENFEQEKTEEKKQPEESKAEVKKPEETKKEIPKQQEEPKAEEQKQEFSLRPEDELKSLIYLREKANEIKLSDESKKATLEQYKKSLDKLIKAESTDVNKLSFRERANLEGKKEVMYDALNEYVTDLLGENIDSASKTRLNNAKSFSEKMAASHLEKSHTFGAQAKEQEQKEAQRQAENQRRQENFKQKQIQKSAEIRNHDSELEKKTGKKIADIKSTIAGNAMFINQLTVDQKDKTKVSSNETVNKNMWISSYLGNPLDNKALGGDYWVGRDNMLFTELQVLGMKPEDFKSFYDERTKALKELALNSGTEYKDPIPGAENMTDVEYKNYFVNKMLTDYSFTKNDFAKEFIDYAAENYGINRNNEKSMVEYMNETLKTVSIQSSIDPGNPVKNAILMGVKKNLSESMTTRGKYYLATPLARDKNLLKAVDSSMKIDHIIIKGNEAKNEIFNNTLPSEKIPEGYLANYMAGKMIENMLIAEQKQMKDSLKNGKYPNSRTADVLNKVCPSKDPYELASLIMKTDTFKKISNLNPTMLRDAIVTDDPGINKLQKTLFTDVKNQAEKEITYVESKGTSVREINEAEVSQEVKQGESTAKEL